MNIDRFRRICYEEFKRDYYMDETTFHAKALCYCRHKMLNQRYDDVIAEDRVLIGLLVDRGIGTVMRNEVKVYEKNVEGYTVRGTPDYFEDGSLVEYKFTMYPPRAPRPHDVMQVKMYMWLVDVNKANIWYFSPNGIEEYKVEGAYSDEYILRIIEKPRYPMWNWECKYCNLYPCEHVMSEEVKL